LSAGPFRTERLHAGSPAATTLFRAEQLAIARRKPALATFLGAFRDEFKTRISPTIGLVRDDARKDMFTVAAFGGFRDAICMSAVLARQAQTLKAGFPRGIRHSDAFDWFLTPQMDGRISVFTPALAALHEVKEIRPQKAPALGSEPLSYLHLDKPLLHALVIPSA
jgi:hypothetical protein